MGAPERVAEGPAVVAGESSAPQREAELAHRLRGRRVDCWPVARPGGWPRSFSSSRLHGRSSTKTVAHDLRPQSSPGVLASTHWWSVPVAVSDSGVTSEARSGRSGRSSRTSSRRPGSLVATAWTASARVCDGVVLGCSVENGPGRRREARESCAVGHRRLGRGRGAPLALIASPPPATTSTPATASADTTLDPPYLRAVVDPGQEVVGVEAVRAAGAVRGRRAADVRGRRRRSSGPPLSAVRRVVGRLRRSVVAPATAVGIRLLTGYEQSELRQRLRRLALHGAHRAAQGAGDLGLGHVLVVPQRDHRPLLRRKGRAAPARGRRRSGVSSVPRSKISSVGCSRPNLRQMLMLRLTMMRRT